MPDWLIPILQTVGAGVLLAACLAIPKLWIDVVLAKRKTEENAGKFSGIFARLDKVSEDVSYIRGALDGRRDQQ